MKTTIRRIIGALALVAGLPVSAAVWFDTGIATYDSWSADGSNKEVVGVGHWTNTVNAALLPNSSYNDGNTLEISAAGVRNAVTFNSLAPRNVSEGRVAFASLVAFTPCEEMPDADQSVKCSLVILQEVSDAGVTNLSFLGFHKDPGGELNSWQKLSGVEPKLGVSVPVVISLKDDGGATFVKYSVDNHDLDIGGVTWLPIAAHEDEVSQAGYYGLGWVSALSATVEAAEIRLTLPDDFQNMKVVWLKAGGVTVEPESDGSFLIPAGSVVAAKFAPDKGYRLRRSTMVFLAGSHDMDLPEAGRPVPEVGDNLFISELMASNETTLNTSDGVAGLDWVEICNEGDERIDLAAEGWMLSDNPAKEKKWMPIEGNAVIEPYGYLVVFVDSDETGWNSADAHAALGLSGGGEEIALISPEGKIVSQFAFKQQFKDVSIGYGHREQPLVSTLTPAEYRVGGREWKPANGPLGMSAAAEGFEIVTYAFTDNPKYVADVKGWMRDRNRWRANPVTNVCAALSFTQGDSTIFPAAAFPASPGIKGNGFALVVRGAFYVPRAGLWTFACGSDDGFFGTISRLGQSWEWSFDGTKGYGQKTSTFSFPEAGAYELELYYWQNTGNGALDVSVSEGEKTSVTVADFDVLGAEGCPLTTVGIHAARTAVDLAPEMLGTASEVDWRATFTLGALPAEGDAVELRMACSDGFTARLNGVTIADVTREAGRTGEAALESESFAVPVELLKVGENELEVTGRNAGLDDTEFYLAPEVVWFIDDAGLVYFEQPTPGAENVRPGRTGLTPAIAFSEPHGWKNAPFALSMTCEDPNAPIYYTTNGTTPTIASTLYTGPVVIDHTTVVRAASPDPYSILQVDAAATYLFVDDVVRQSEANRPAEFPASGAVNGQAFKYGMRTAIVDGDADTKRRLYNGFTNSMRTVSIVIDPANLFDKSHGIYVNASGDGRGWERKTMVEQINPADPDDGFTYPCGLRIRGAFSRGSAYPKHSFRLFFRSEYGASKLAHPVFGDEGADEFDKIDLRTDQNQSYANGNNSQTLIHDVFSRDCERDLGVSYHRTRYFHLFLNGVYWGVYMYEERCCQEYAASYYGADETDYDIVRTSTPGYNTGVVEGDSTAMNDFWNTITLGEGYGEGHPGNYNRVRGLNPDGSRNPDYPVYLNVTNLIGYVLTSHFTCDTDSPANSGGTMVNNLAAFRCRVDGKAKEDGWLFNRHDAEWSLGFSHRGVNGDNCGLGTRECNCKTFNPHGLHYELCANAEYRTLFADQVYRHMLREGGAMTSAACERRFVARMNELDDGVVAETARWGSTNRKGWANSCTNNCLKFIRNRMPVLLKNYRTRGWYPSIDAPAATNAVGELLNDGYQFGEDERLAFSADPAQGTLYYTLDGSDPRLVGGDVAAGAAAYDGAGIDIPAAGCTVRARVLGANGEWSALEEVSVKGTAKNDAIGDSLRFLAVNGIPADGEGGGDTGEWFALTNLSAVTAFDLTGVKVMIRKEDAKDAKSKCTVTLPSVTIEPGATLVVSQEQYTAETGWEKITNNKLVMKIYGADGAVIQESAVTQADFPTVYGEEGGPGGGAYLVATDFGAVTGATGWKASFTPEYAFLRFCEFCGITADGKKSDTGEWVTLTNTSTWATLSLTNVSVVIGKKDDINMDGDAAAKCRLLLGDIALAPGEAATLRQADYADAGWTKITNGKLLMRLYDADGVRIQQSDVNQGKFARYAAAEGMSEGGDSLVAISFGHETETADWVERSSLDVEEEKPATELLMARYP